MENIYLLSWLNAKQTKNVNNKSYARIKRKAIFEHRQREVQCKGKRQTRKIKSVKIQPCSHKDMAGYVALVYDLSEYELGLRVISCRKRYINSAKRIEMIKNGGIKPFMKFVSDFPIERQDVENYFPISTFAKR